jgi:hypothetical protein
VTWDSNGTSAPAPTAMPSGTATASAAAGRAG